MSGPPPAPLPPQDMLAAYPYADDRFDELFAQPHEPRPHWSRLYDELTGTSPVDIGERQAAA